MNKDPSIRKPLRQRVADRKRGIKEVKPVSEKMKRASKMMRMGFLTAQYLGLIMLLFSLGDIVTNDYRIDNPTLIIVYSMLFLVGRFGIMIMKSVDLYK